MCVAVAATVLRFGGSQTAVLYQTFLLLLVPAASGALLWSSVGLSRLASGALAVVGGGLLLQISIEGTLDARGYVVASVGWLTLVVGLWLVRRDSRLSRMLWFFLLALGGLEALYGLVQAVGGVDQIGTYERGLGRIATGTLINRNHFAGLLNMTLPLAVGALFAGYLTRVRANTRRSEVHAWALIFVLMIGLMGSATFLSGSRGGAVSLLVTLAFLFGLMVRRGRSAASLPAVAVPTLVVVTLATGLTLGMDLLVGRFLERSEVSRPQIYLDTLAMIRDHPWMGVGPGLYSWKFRAYQSIQAESLYLHAHNDYLETAAEWGVPLALLFWGFVVWRLWRASVTFVAAADPHVAGLSLGCAGATVSILVHSTIDFNLQIPGNLMVFALVLALGWGAEQGKDELMGARSVRWLILLLLVVAGLQVSRRVAAIRVMDLSEADPAIERALRLDPKNADLHFESSLLLDFEDPTAREAALNHLEQAVELFPHDWRYWAELSWLYELDDRTEESERSLLRAIALNPQEPNYQLQLATLRLSTGSRKGGLEALRTALLVDEELFEPALTLLQQEDMEVDSLDAVWPAEPGARLALVRLLVAQEQDLVDLGNVGRNTLILDQWHRVLSQSSVLTIDQGDFLIDYLLGEGEWVEARRQWSELARAAGLHDDKFEQQREFVWNSGFSHPPSGALFDWQIAETAGLVAEWRSENDGAFEGALRIDFDGTRNIELAGVEQQVIVTPGALLRLGTRLKSSGMSTDEGIFVEVADPRTGIAVAEAPSVSGSVPWNRREVALRVPDDTHLLVVRLRRRPSLRLDNLLSGTLWIDELSLSRQPE